MVDDENESTGLAILHSPRFVDSRLPGWSITPLEGGDVLLEPVDSPPPTPVAPPREKKEEKTPVTKEKKRIPFFAAPLPKGKPTRKIEPGPGQYNINRDLVGNRWSFGYCPNRKHLSAAREMASWVPSSQTNDTPGPTYVEKRKHSGGIVIGLPIATPRWGLKNDRPLELPPPLGQTHPCERSAPKWIIHKLDNKLDDNPKDVPPVPIIELSKPRTIGDDRSSYPFGLRPHVLRYHTADWTSNQRSLMVGPGQKYNHQTTTTRFGRIGNLGGPMGGHCGKKEMVLPTAGRDVPNMNVLDKYESRTLRSQSLQGRRFPTHPRLGPYNGG